MRDSRNSEMVSVPADAGYSQPVPAAGKASVAGVCGPIPVLSGVLGVLGPGMTRKRGWEGHEAHGFVYRSDCDR